MNWKDVLKPSARKFLLALFLLLFFTLAFGIPVRKFALCEWIINIEMDKCERVISFYSIAHLIDDRHLLNKGLYLQWHIYLFEIILCYIAACLAVYYYGASKSKSKI